MADARILIVDDHPLFREALRHALSAGKTHLEISEAGSLDTLIALLALPLCASSCVTMTSLVGVASPAECSHRSVNQAAGACRRSGGIAC